MVGVLLVMLLPLFLLSLLSPFLLSSCPGMPLPPSAQAYRCADRHITWLIKVQEAAACLQMPIAPSWSFNAGTLGFCKPISLPELLLTLAYVILSLVTALVLDLLVDAETMILSPVCQADWHSRMRR